MSDAKKTLILNEGDLLAWSHGGEGYILKACPTDITDEDLLPQDGPVKTVLAGPGLYLNNTGLDPKELLQELARSEPDGRDLIDPGRLPGLLEAANKDAVAMPVYGYSHGGLALSLERTGQFADPYDAGFCGVVAMRRTDAVQNGADPGNWREWAKKRSQGLVASLNAYLGDGAYELRLIRNDGEKRLDSNPVLDSFGPFMGSDLLSNGAVEIIDGAGYGLSGALEEGTLRRGRIRKVTVYEAEIEEAPHG